MIRVLLVDDHDMLLEGLQAALAAHGDIDVVATASSFDDGLVRFGEVEPDVVVTDYRIGTESGADLARAILLADPKATVIVVSALRSAHTIADVVDAGCVGFVDKQKGVADLVTAIRLTAEGSLFFPRDVLESAGARPTAALSPRELDVLQRLSDGTDVTTIARELQLSPNTVRNHVRQILRKLDVSSQLAAVAKATRDGIIPGQSPTG